MNALQFNLFQSLFVLLPVLFVVLFGLVLYRVTIRPLRQSRKAKVEQSMEGNWPLPPNKPSV